jgi:transposase InsO family protein
VKTLLVELGNPWENGYNQSFNSKLTDEMLNRQHFTTLYEAQLLIERWRQHYNAVRPHTSLGYRPLTLETVLPPAFELPHERRVLTRNWYRDAGLANTRQVGGAAE